MIGLRGSCHKRQKPQAPTPQAPIRNRQTKKVANAKVRNRCANLTYIMIGLQGSCHKRQKLQAPTPQALIRNRQTRRVANAKVRNRYTNVT